MAAFGIAKLKIGKFSNSASLSSPLWIKSIIPLVYLSDILYPTPYLPPDHPVLISHTLVSCFLIFSANILAYNVGWRARKASPKHAENVAYGSLTPTSVPATLAV